MMIGLAIGEQAANTIADLKMVMQQRFGPGFGVFWLSHRKCGYPMLNVLIRNNVATLHFLEQEGEPGHLSVGNPLNMDPQGTTEFAISSSAGDNLIFSNGHVISLAKAMEAAEEFFVSGSRPESVEWVENG